MVEIAEPFISVEQYEAALEGMALAHRAELAKGRMQLIRYRTALVEAGIEPPDANGEDLLEMWRDAAAVIDAASQFVHTLGTSAELLSTSIWDKNDKWRRVYSRWAAR